MKKIIIAFYLIIAGFSLSGCAEFLDRPAYGSNPTWKTEEDITKAIYAFYNFASNQWSEELCGRGHMWLECASDNIVVGRSRPNVEIIREFKMPPSSGEDVRFLWEVMYQNNAKANNILKIVPTMKLNEKFTNNALGTAYFFRGFSMLWLAPYYGDDTNGGIPIITDKTEPVNMDSPRPKHVTMNYDQIIADLRKAGDLLPYFSELATADYGLPHKAAAWAFAARAALYAAQYDAKYLDVVIEMTDKIMALGGADKRSLYKSADNSKSYANLWRKEQNHSSEYIFSLEGSDTNGARYHGVTFVNGGWGLYNTWGYFAPTKGLYDAFEQGDTRRDHTILYPGQTVRFMSKDLLFAGYNTDGTVDKTKENTTSHVTAGLINRKFLSPFEESNSGDFSPLRDKLYNKLNLSLIRYADVVLMKAEALIWKNGEGNATAKELINDVRERAGLPRNSQATKAQLQNERRCELAMEFMPSRHQDVIRWGLAQEYYSKPTYSVITTRVDGKLVAEPIEAHPGRSFNPTYHKVFPIPITAFTGTKHLKQNLGY